METTSARRVGNQYGKTEVVKTESWRQSVASFGCPPFRAYSVVACSQKHYGSTKSLLPAGIRRVFTKSTSTVCLGLPPSFGGETANGNIIFLQSMMIAGYW